LKTLIENLAAPGARGAARRPGARARAPSAIEVERTRDAQHGDFASNLAMRLAKATRQNPRKLAKPWWPRCRRSGRRQVEIAGAGFINFFSSRRRLPRGDRQGCSSKARLRPLAIRRRPFGAGGIRLGEPHRPAARRPRPARRLRRDARQPARGGVGYRVAREYYINDAGRQMDILAVSTWLRYLEHCGERFTFPANGYRGDYIAPIAERLFAPRAAAAHRAAECSRICRRTSRRAATRTSTSTR
jgi:arginyl-tRNA synthetase